MTILHPDATVRMRLKNLVVYALPRRHDVAVVETTSRGHAIDVGTIGSPAS
jgi:hypothetical protein